MHLNGKTSEYPRSNQYRTKKLEDLETLNLETIEAMTYLETVIKEVLRVFPPVPGGIRKVIQDCSFGGYKIPKNWYVTYDIKTDHQDSEIYTHPDRFAPERFNNENREDKKQPYSYIPFGGGLRECLCNNENFCLNLST